MNQRTLTYVLVGSIALNAFLLGITSMHVFGRRSGFEERRRGGDANNETFGDPRGPRFLRQLVRAAGGPRDPRVRELWSGRRQHLGPLRQELLASSERVLDVMEREPFDREELAKALDAALSARHRADQLANEGALQLAEKLTANERADFCRAARSARRPARDKRRPDRPPGEQDR